jgi:hypothetical protein
MGCPILRKIRRELGGSGRRLMSARIATAISSALPGVQCLSLRRPSFYLAQESPPLGAQEILIFSCGAYAHLVKERAQSSGPLALVLGDSHTKCELNR